MSSQFEPVSFIEIVRSLLKEKYRIVLVSFFASVVVAIVSLFLPNMYVSTASILPNPNRGVGFDIFSESGGLQGIASAFLGQEDGEANRFYILLESRTTKELVIKEFDLINRYELSSSKKPLIDAMSVLDKNTNFESKEEGHFIIQVWDEDPTVAKAMADYYIELLNARNTEVAIREAKLYRDFIENRYDQSKIDLDVLRKDLQAFQEENGIYELPEQVMQYFQVIAELSAAKLQAEIQLDVLSSSVSQQSDSYKRVYTEVEAIDNKINEIYTDTLANNLFLNMDDLSANSLRYYELQQEIEIQSEIQKFIIPLYEQAKLEEAKSLPIVSIIDQPSLATAKDKPRRSLIVIFAGASIFILVIAYYILRLSYFKNIEYLKSLIH